MLLVVSLLALALGLLAASAAPALGQPAMNPTRRAAELAEQAADAYAEGEVQLAITLFHEAMSYVPDPAFAFNLAQLYDSLDEWPQAYRFYSRYLELYPGAPNLEQVTTRMEDLETVMVLTHARLVVTSEPEGAQVTVAVDGGRADPYGVTPIDGWVNPGQIDIAVTAEGYRPVVRHMLARPGVRLEIDFGALEPAAVAADPGDPAAEPGDGGEGTTPGGPGGLGADPIEPPPSDGRARRIAAWSLIGAGLAAGGLTTYFWIDADNTEQDYNSLAADLREGRVSSDSLTGAQRELLADTDGPQDQATIGNILLGVGVAAILGGSLLLILGDDDEATDPSPSLAFGPFATPAGAGLSWSGSF